VIVGADVGWTVTVVDAGRMPFPWNRSLCFRPLCWCIAMSKDGLGTIHLHSKLWRPGTISSAWYVQPDAHQAHHVPMDRFRELSQATTPLHAMAILRRDD
jgi:hypothetical protein